MPRATLGSLDLWSYSVAMVLVLLRKKRGKNRACAEHTSGSGPLPVTLVWRHLRWKGPTRADIAQLPVAHAQNILPDRDPVTWLTSLPVKTPTRADIAQLPVARAQNILPERDPVTRLSVTWLTWLPVAPPQIITELSPYTTNTHSPKVNWFADFEIGKIKNAIYMLRGYCLPAA